MTQQQPDIILYHGKITTLDKQKPEVSAIALGAICSLYPFLDVILFP